MQQNQNHVEFYAKRDPNSEIIRLKIPFNAHFIDVINSLKKAFNSDDICYFEYLDEDNDNVIVSCEDGLQSVFSYYSELIKDSINHGVFTKPLQVCVKSIASESNFQTAGSPNLTISLEYQMLPNEKDCHSNSNSNCSSKSHSGSISGGGMFISTTGDERVSQLAYSDRSSTSPMSEDNCDNSYSQWSISPRLCEENVYLMGEIGSGSTGRVMRALYTPTQEVIAVKIIDLDMDSEDTVKQQILSELAILRLSKSAHIIDFYGAFFVESSIYICTQFMDGHSLDRYGVIADPILSKLVVLIVNGLVYLWTNKIIHRDVKPSNMLINTSGQVKLCDFGISKQLVHSIAKTYTGTVAFMSPERLRGELYRISSDVWSLGISIYLLGTGKHPFIDKDAPVTPALVMNSIFQSTNDINSPSLSHAMLDFITKCLDKQPNRRFDTVSIVQHQIYQLNCGNYATLLSQWVFDHSP